jgi:hypothetical protein
MKRVHKNIEAQYVMEKPSEHLVFNYNEAMVQFGFLTLFSNAFTIAPLFSLLTNLLEIKIKLDSAGKYSRRGKADGGSGIGIWSQIMEFLSFLAIPVNIAILFFCGHNGNSTEGAIWESLQKTNVDPYYTWDG